MVYYRETESGDYLAIDPASNGYHRLLGRDHFDGRAAAIAGQAGSVCSTGVSREYLRTCCTRVAEAGVPTAWRRAIGT